MRWIHLSDIHFYPNDTNSRIVQQLRNQLLEYISSKNIKADEMFLTGDFRQANIPSDDENILITKTISFIQGIANRVGIVGNEHIHIVPGNHDLTRTSFSPSVEEIRAKYKVDEGAFDAADLNNLISRFDYFKKIDEHLHPGDSVWRNGSSPIHVFKASSEYAILYLNTAITSQGGDGDKRELVIGNCALYEKLEELKQQSAMKPIIILAHHSSVMMKEEEERVIEEIFERYPVVLYLCGHAHQITCRKINNVTEYVSGCMVAQSGLHATFSHGELSGQQHNIVAHLWDANTKQWNEYDGLNQRYRRRTTPYIGEQPRILLDDDWFLKQNEFQFQNLGRRYSPEVNVPTSTNIYIDALSRNVFFRNRFLERAAKVIKALKRRRITDFGSPADLLANSIDSITFEGVEDIDFMPITSAMDNIFELLRQALKREYDKEKEKQDPERINRLSEADSELGDFYEYIQSDEMKMVNAPFCILSGEGGIGKSHLIADSIMRRNMYHERSILLLGQQFHEGEDITTQIRKILNIECSNDDMLKQFNSVGMQQKTRFLIFVDAINEGCGIGLWRRHLEAFIGLLAEYPYLGLIISIRTQYLRELYRDNRISNETIMIRHSGFSTKEYAAMQAYFTYYNIVYTNIPMSIDEFQNPLFLRLFCEAHKNTSIANTDISLRDTYSYYLREINNRIAERCSFSSHYNVVQKAIKAMVELRYSTGEYNNHQPIAQVIELILGIERTFNLNISLLDELLSEGILTKSIYRGKEFIHVTYEKLEDYMYAEMLASELVDVGKEIFAEKYNNLLNRGDLLECLAIAMPENTEFEICDIFPSDNQLMTDAFINSFKWRDKASIREKTLALINNEVLVYEYSFNQFIAMLVLLSTRKNHPLNAEYSFSIIMDYNMPDRDAVFIKAFDRAFIGEASPINFILDWCLNWSKKEDDESIRLAAFMVALFLISPNIKLRDKSTKALIQLLAGKTKILIELLQKYCDSDDPYMLERLYAVAFGCAVKETDENALKGLALCVYNLVFNKDTVYPNILLRDYAKNAIEYAISVVGDLRIPKERITQPFHCVFPVIPSDEEIQKYKRDYKADDFKDYYWSQEIILDSMRVEYTRDGQPGGYGDFGRYTFQSYFQSWKELNPNDLMNIAVKRIFDLGYDVEKHGKYDRTCKHGRSRGDNERERIGKKYQWIALYELAAQVADNYLLELDTSDFQVKTKAYCPGSFEPSIRNIDPTISFHEFDTAENDRPIHDDLYRIPDIQNTEWTSSFLDFPDANMLIQIQEKDKEYLLLNGWYKWTEKKRFGNEDYSTPRKDMWIFINSYIVKSDELPIYISQLEGQNFMGRWLAEPNENYTLFNREYYWSEANEFFSNPYYGAEESVPLDKYGDRFKDFQNVIVPTHIYCTERCGDNPNTSSRRWYKPCNTLFHKMNMEYREDDSVLYNNDGKAVCFDSQELLNEDIGFFIDKNEFLRFLSRNGYSVFWTVLGDKQIIGNRGYNDDNISSISISGIYHFEDGVFKGNTTEFKE